MPYKLSKTLAGEFDNLAESMRLHAVGLTEAVEAYNQAVEEARAELQEKIDEYNGSQTDTHDFIEENIVNPWRDKFDAKSDKWQESDAGREVESQINEWDSRMEEMADDIEIETPDPIEIETPDFDAWPDYEGDA